MEIEEEDCGDECVIDPTKTHGTHSSSEGEVSEDETNGTLVILTQGTYGRFDDGFSANQVVNALRAMDLEASLLLLSDGVYYAVKDQDPTEIGLPNNLSYIEDFLSLGGRVLASLESMGKRGIQKSELVEGTEIVDDLQIAQEITKHKFSLTF